MVIFQMLFLVCELYKSGRHTTAYFGYGQYFIWEILVLAVMETARPKNTSFINFFWSGNETILVCKLYVKSVIFYMFQILDNTYIDRFRLVAFVKYILSLIYSYCIQNCTFWNFLEIAETFVSWKKYFQSLLIIMFFYPKTSNFHDSGMIGHRKLSDPSVNKIFNVLSISL